MLLLITSIFLSCNREESSINKTTTNSENNNVENRVAEPCEPDDNGAPCQKQYWGSVMLLEMFPGCQFQIEWTKFDCGPNGIYYSTPQIWSHQCPDFTS